MLMIMGISDETRNKLTIYAMFCRKVNILPTRAIFFISSAGKIENVQKFKFELLE